MAFTPIKELMQPLYWLDRKGKGAQKMVVGHFEI